MAKLTGQKRSSLSDSDFCMPDERKYPVHDRAHAANALSRARQQGPAVYARVKRCVCRRFHDLPSCSEKE
jgi:hypothetical protein